MANRGILGSFFNNDCAILFFILVFLILFMGPSGSPCGGYAYADPN